MLTQEHLKELLTYNLTTGVFTWNVKTRNGRRQPGDVAGGANNEGYWHISILGKKYKAHRLVFFYVYGHWPKEEVDHINNVRDDNRLSNLRCVPKRLNARNRLVSKTKVSGLPKGVYKIRDSFRATIRINKKPISLGCYKTVEEAVAAYAVASEQYHKEYGKI